MTTPWEVGNPEAKILFLAEAPSFMEMKLGEPLVGPSGDVFNNCLHTAGLARSQAYILNVWPFQVWKNEKSGDFYIYKSNRGPMDMLWHHNKGFTDLGREHAAETLAKIDRCGANVIVTMGAQAFELMIDSRLPIMKWRGSILTAFNGRKMIPTVHPAATLHGVYTWRYLIINDFEKAKRQMGFSEVRLPQRNIIIKPGFKDVMEYFDYVERQPEFATDLEAMNHQVHCFCLAPSASECMVIPLVWEGQEPYWTIDEETEIWLRYAQLMGNESIGKINQNILGFDIPFLLDRNNIFTRGPIRDTMIAQHIMYPNFNKGLDFITSVHTDEPYYKDEGKMWKSAGGSLEQFWTYNGKDGCVAFEAWLKLADEMTAGNYWQTYNMTVRLQNPLNFMAIKGFKVEQAELAEVRKKTEELIIEKQKALDAITGGLNPLSPKQCKEYFYEKKKCHPYQSAKGTISTDDKSLARIYRRYHLKEAKLVQELRGLHKLQGTYFEITFDADQRMRCSWNPRGTWTGRLSSGKTIFDTGMNQQNLPIPFKVFLVADA
jgi:uracil-DNA glycosylase